METTFPAENLDEVQNTASHLAQKEIESGTRMDPVDVMTRLRAADPSKHFDRKLSPDEVSVFLGTYIGAYKYQLNLRR